VVPARAHQYTAVGYIALMSRLSMRAPWLLAVVFIAGCAAVPPRKPDDVNAHLVAAEIALARGEDEIAAEEYQRVTELSADPGLAGRAADVALRSGRDDIALIVTNRWLALDSANPAARRAAGLAALRLSELPRAIELIEGSLDASGEAADKQLLELVAALSNESNAYGVFVVARAIADQRPSSAVAQYSAAAFALPAFNYGYAAEAAQRAVNLKPDFADGERLLARALVMSGQVQSGLELAGRAAADGDVDARLELGILNEFAGRNAEARKLYESLLESQAARGDAVYELAQLDFRERHYEDAARRFTELLTLGRQVGADFYYLGAIAERRGDSARAIRFYSRIVSGNFAVDAQLRTARLLREGGLARQGEESLDAYVRDHPESEIEIAIGRSRGLSDQLQHRAALELVDRYLARFPDNMDLVMQRALVLERASRVSEAVATLRKLLRQRPNDPVALNALGYTLVDHDRRLREGEELVRRALMMMPDNPAIEDSLGWVLFRRGRYVEAADTLRKAYDAVPDPEVAAHLGEALWKMGDRERARAIWQEGLGIAPGDPYLNETVRRYPQH